LAAQDGAVRWRCPSKGSAGAAGGERLTAAPR
jgi:hypothetical protein